MSNTSNGAVLSATDAEATRYHQAQGVSRLLREYTQVMYELADRFAIHLEKNCTGIPYSILSGVLRYQALWEELGSAALFASQMLVQYQLDEAVAAELRLRLADAETSIQTAGKLLEGIIMPDLNLLKSNPNYLGSARPVPSLITVAELVKLAEKIKEERERNTEAPPGKKK